MAYGVKFRLEFSDDNLQGKKIEILKDGYTGTVKSLIGTKDPVQIDWSGDDNFYEPIIGSTCKINLYVTDDTDYDDFYDSNERDYQVKIFYKDTSDTYQLYWVGYLLVDEFREAITSTPFTISLQAYDGLGSLRNYDQPIDTSSTSFKTLMYYIHNILDNLDLDLDIYVSNDIRKTGASGSTYTIYDQVSVSPHRLMKSGYDIDNARNTLEGILKFTNARIFQSFGRWYIINNSSYSEQSVKDSSETTAEGGTVPTGIRAAETLSLQTDETEEIKYFIYNSSGVYQSTSTVDVLSQVPSDLQPLNNNLIREFIRPLNKYEIEIEDSQLLDTNIVNNPGFEHGTFGWTLTNTSLDSTLSKQGNYSVKNTQVQTSELNTSVIIRKEIDYTANARRAWTFKIATYLDTSYTGDRSFRFLLRHDNTHTPGGTETKYWSVSNNTWQTTSVANIVDIEENNAWIENSFQVDSLPVQNGKLRIDIYQPYQAATTGFNGIYFDNILFEYERKDDDGERKDFYAEIDEFVFKRERSSANLSGDLKTDGVRLTNAKYSAVSGVFYRSRDDHSTLDKTLEEITTQQVMNDFRKHMTRYEGDLYNNNNKPISLHNKIWINFGTSILQEPVSCYIDSMTYNVKRNVYAVVLHIPNQDDDISSTFSVKI
jgi:hypothetical protein